MGEELLEIKIYCKKVVSFRKEYQNSLTYVI